jgi:hypothetical protein
MSSVWLEGLAFRMTFIDIQFEMSSEITVGLLEEAYRQSPNYNTLRSPRSRSFLMSSDSQCLHPSIVSVSAQVS